MSYWLIERNITNQVGGAEWWDGVSWQKGNPSAFAIRYSRKQDAERARTILLYSNETFVSEHSDIERAISAMDYRESIRKTSQKKILKDHGYGANFILSEIKLCKKELEKIIDSDPEESDEILALWLVNALQITPQLEARGVVTIDGMPEGTVSARTWWTVHCENESGKANIEVPGPNVPLDSSQFSPQKLFTLSDLQHFGAQCQHNPEWSIKENTDHFITILNRGENDER